MPVKVLCACNHVLGSFKPQDDHSGVEMWCPFCRRWNRIDNQVLCHPEEYGGTKDEVTIHSIQVFISPEEYQRELILFGQTKKAVPTVRLGQFFCNKFPFLLDKEPNLFYEEDPTKAKEMIEKYLLAEEKAEPVFTHDCANCELIGSLPGLADFYICQKPDTVDLLVRYSSDGPDYASHGLLQGQFDEEFKTLRRSCLGGTDAEWRRHILIRMTLNHLPSVIPNLVK